VSFEISLNGDPRTIEPGTTVGALIDELGGANNGRGVAVALDGAVVPFSAWAATPIGSGAHVEVLVAVQGG
jgi:sulfur carrier protein